MDSLAKLKSLVPGGTVTPAFIRVGTMRGPPYCSMSPEKQALNLKPLARLVASHAALGRRASWAMAPSRTRKP